MEDYYHADHNAISALESDTDVTVTICNDSITFKPATDYDTGIIFYPGAKVETSAYAMLCREYAEQGIYVALVEMPFHLAILDTNKADDIDNPNVEHWYMAGHSLGGVCAATYAYNHTERIEGLILLASYSTKNLSNTDLKVISIYGSQDGVLNLDSYSKHFENLPDDCTEYIIEGGNHAQFGNYGIQKGDGKASISSDIQQEETVTQTLLWMD